MDSIPKGYKKTEIGVIPEDWDCRNIGGLCQYQNGTSLEKYFNKSSGFKVISIGNYSDSGKFVETGTYISKSHFKELSKFILKENDLTMILNDKTSSGGIIGRVLLVEENNKYIFNQRTMKLVVKNDDDPRFLYFQINSDTSHKRFVNLAKPGTQIYVNTEDVLNFLIAIPESKQEQTSITKVLSDIDSLITSLERHIEKKKLIKQGVMQELLTGKRRLKGFSGEWEKRTIEQSANCLDNLRVPLNDLQRKKMKGTIPYCGANGILDYVDNYVIDDDIILIAEDGGYFDEYETRPIAYRITGKCWVNNHAHILKAKENFDQGFLFYSLVHKNILDYINGGTRAKLNKFEMYKIEIKFPPSKDEQTAIADILSDLDLEIEKLKTKHSKLKNIKSGAMQQLLTGKIRLINK